MKAVARIALVAGLAATLVVPAAQAANASHGSLDPWMLELYARQAHLSLYANPRTLDPWMLELQARASDALARANDVSAVSRPRSQALAQPSGASSNRFDWGAFGIGLATMLGLVALVGIAVALRGRRRVGHGLPSA